MLAADTEEIPDVEEDSLMRSAFPSAVSPPTDSVSSYKQNRKGQSDINIRTTLLAADTDEIPEVDEDSLMRSAFPSAVSPPTDSVSSYKQNRKGQSDINVRTTLLAADTDEIPEVDEDSLMRSAFPSAVSPPTDSVSSYKQNRKGQSDINIRTTLLAADTDEIPEVEDSLVRSAFPSAVSPPTDSVSSYKQNRKGQSDINIRTTLLAADTDEIPEVDEDSLMRSAFPSAVSPPTDSVSS